MSNGEHEGGPQSNERDFRSPETEKGEDFTELARQIQEANEQIKVLEKSKLDAWAKLREMPDVHILHINKSQERCDLSKEQLERLGIDDPGPDADFDELKEVLQKLGYNDVENISDPDFGDASILAKKYDDEKDNPKKEWSELGNDEY